jgi:glycine cleavage system regulatory protein
MTTPLVLTFVGDDRPGLVNAISERVAASGATWLESRSVRLAGKFAGVVLISVADDRLTELELSLSDLAPAGLRITIERGAAAEAEKPARIVSLGILGRERPGIVRE